MSSYISDRVKEASSHQGLIVAVAAAAVLFGGLSLTKVVLYGALVWGVWSMMKRDQIMAELETEVKLLKKELQDQAKIHDRLDVAIEKLTDVSNSIHRMLAVHEEKIARQEEAIFEAEQKIEVRRSELLIKIDELHSRVTTNTKEIMTAAAAQHQQQNKEIQKMRDELISRVGVLEKWRHVLIGGSIVIGFMLHKFVNFGS